MNDIPGFGSLGFAVGFRVGRRGYRIVQQVRGLFLRRRSALWLTLCRSDAVFNDAQSRPEGDKHHQHADDKNEDDLFIASDWLGSAEMSPSFHNKKSLYR